MIDNFIDHFSSLGIFNKFRCFSEQSYFEDPPKIDTQT